jgi:hypothetical protein
MWIDEDEISHIIEYGVYGSNATNRSKLGGGFGLTKAYFFTKQFNGTFQVKVRNVVNKCLLWNYI